MFSKSAAALAAVLSLAGAAPASAAFLVVEASGVMASGYDPNNVLGATPDEYGAIYDIPMTLMLTYDLGSAVHIDDAGTDTWLGGFSYSAPNVAAATFTLQGGSYSMTGAGYSVALQNLTTLQQALSPTAAGTPFIQVGANFPGEDLTADVTAPPSGNICAVATCYGDFALANGINGRLGVTTYTVSIVDSLPGDPAPIPEPATWALLIAGFGLAGAQLRARRRVSV